MLNHPAYQRASYQDIIRSIPGLVAYWPGSDSSGSVRGPVGPVGTVSGTVSYLAPSGTNDPTLGFTAVASTQVSGTGTTLPVGAGTTTWTFLGWVYMPTVTANSSHLFGFGKVAGVSPVTPGSFRRVLRFTSKVYYWGDTGDLAGSEDFDVGKPQLIAATRTSAGLITLSKNGRSMVSGTPTFNSTTDQNMSIGTKPYFGGGAEFTGRVSHFAIATTPLSLNDLRHLYAEGIK
jgi:hypothetical protein